MMRSSAAPLKGTRRRAGGTRLAPLPPSHGIAEVLLNELGHQIAEQAVCLTTPAPELSPLSELKLPALVSKFIEGYVPAAASQGIYEHQATVLKALGGKKKIPNVVMMTATGSGKSLAFWSWALAILDRDPDATIIAAFPTQALLWGQAHRMERLSEAPKGADAAFAGTLKLGRQRIPWTVWYGTWECPRMKAHAQTEAFARARIRLCTLDKVHWSLMREQHADFLSGLRGVILDEAHTWHGLGGASVRMMLNRMRLSLRHMASC